MTLNPTKLRAATKLFWVCLVFNVFCASGHNDSIDAGASIDTARALFERGSPRLNTVGAYDLHILARGKGGYYSKLGLTHPVLYLPAVAAGKLVALWRGQELRWIEFFASLTNPFFHALLVALLFSFFKTEGTSTTLALLLSLGTGYATLLFPYAKTLHREVLQALFFTALFVLISNSNNLNARRLFWCGVLIGATLLIKIGLIVPLLPVLLFLGLQMKPRPLRPLLTVLLPIVVSIVALLVFWKFNAAGPNFSGYGPQVFSPSDARAWSTPFWQGIYTQILSPEDGLLWYSPLVIAALVVSGLKAWQKRWSVRDSCVLACIVLHIALHAKWFDAAGKGPLGPRYVVTILPLFALLCSNLPTLRHKTGRVFAAASLTLLLVWSLSLQFIFVCIKPQMYNAIIYAGRPVPKEGYEPQWIAEFRIFAHKLHAKPEIYSTSLFNPATPAKEVDFRTNRSYHGFNFWWLHALRGEKPF